MPVTVIRRSVPVKGMNTVISPRNMTAEFAPLIENMWYDDGLSIRKRLGKTVSNPTLVPGGGVKYRFEYSYRTITKLFIQDIAGGIHQDIGTAYTLNTPTFTGSLGSAQLKGNIIVGDGVANAMRYDGTAWTPPSVTPTPVGDATIGSIFFTYKGRCYAAGSLLYPLTVFISDTITSTGVDYWGQNLTGTTGDTRLGYLLDCSGDVSSGDKITGIITHKGYLVVFCTNNILFYTISESLTSGWGSSLYKSVSGEGCISPNSIAAIGEEVIFLSPNGFKKLSVSLIQGDSQVNDISNSINNTVKELLNNGTINLSSISATYNPRYGLYICNIGTTQWVYQTMFDGWFIWRDSGLVFFTDSNLLTYSDDLYAHTIGNAVFQDEVTPAIFAPITSRWEIAPFRSPSLEHRPRWKKMELVYEVFAPNSAITVSYFRDMNTIMPPIVGAYSLNPTRTLANGARSGRFELPISGRSELISFEVKHSANSDLRINLVEVYETDGGMR